MGKDNGLRRRIHNIFLGIMGCGFVFVFGLALLLVAGVTAHVVRISEHDVRSLAIAAGAGIVVTVIVVAVDAWLFSDIIAEDRKYRSGSRASLSFALNVFPIIMGLFFGLGLFHGQVSIFARAAVFGIVWFLSWAIVRALMARGLAFRRTLCKLGLTPYGQSAAFDQSSPIWGEGLYRGLKCRVTMGTFSRTRNSRPWSIINALLETPDRSFKLYVATDGPSDESDLQPVTMTDPFFTEITVESNSPETAQTVLTKNLDLIKRLMSGSECLGVNVPVSRRSDKLFAGVGQITVARRAEDVYGELMDDIRKEIAYSIARQTPNRDAEYAFLTPLLDDLVTLSQALTGSAAAVITNSDSAP